MTQKIACSETRSRAEKGNTAVEVLIGDNGLGSRMADMRRWADKNGLLPDGFFYSQLSNGLRLVVQFGTSEAASAFGDRFGGRLIAAPHEARSSSTGAEDD